MKRRILVCLLAVCLLLATVPAVAAYRDTDDHWARAYIEEVTELGLFQGTGDDQFSPNLQMSRGMFVTVLGRFEGVVPEEWMALPFFTDVPQDSYYAPYISWAAIHGIVNGMDEDTFAPDAPVTREQMAKMIHYYCIKLGHELPNYATTTEEFTDSADISEWAMPSIRALQSCGILNGMPTEEGGFAFVPQGTATRAEGAAVFSRLHDALNPVLPQHLSLDVTELVLEVGNSYALRATVEPMGTLAWESSDPSYVVVDDRGVVTARAMGEATVTVRTENGLEASCRITVTAPLPNASYTKADKCNLIFGEYVSDPRLYYQNSEAAFADMRNITVKCWDLNKSGEKYTRTWTITVHKNIAPAVQAIFAEIYAGEEQFPIQYLGSYGWSGKSEHSIGCAIDINYLQNYYCDPDGNAITGNYWKPYEDPYSITPDGDVVRAFEKYGFVWCIKWNSGYKDYMHFSFFGT